MAEKKWDLSSTFKTARRDNTRVMLPKNKKFVTPEMRLEAIDRAIYNQHLRNLEMDRRRREERKHKKLGV